jgi:hypothetical protein
MFIKIIKKIILIVTALSMLTLSLVTWRYQGDIYHMHTRLFKSDKNYSDSIYKILWESVDKKDSTKEIKMREITLFELLSRFQKEPTSYHPSELLMDKMIKSDRWSRFIPNSNSTTYPVSQKLWMSKNITIKEVMNYILIEAEELSEKRFHKKLEKLSHDELKELL